MWLDMVEFRSASSEIRGRKQKEEERIAVKHKSADEYVERPKYRKKIVYLEASFRAEKSKSV